MAIINVTPDSFSQDGCLQKHKDYVRAACRLAKGFVREGADILDVGGESSRPGARPVTVKEELRRVIPVIEALKEQVPVPISVDTYKPQVAQAALKAGASIVNNIKGTQVQRSLIKWVCEYNAAIVLMHMGGRSPATMQRKIFYRNLIDEIIVSLKKSMEICLDFGLKLDKIIVDPGIGFGKTVEHNCEIIQRLADFAQLRRPILVGTSRKSFIGKILGNDEKERLLGTGATVCASVMNGAHIVRVHDVAAMAKVVRMTDALLS